MGTGYTRQSSASIVDGQVINAAPLNNEFNAIKDAFDSAVGHSHDGTTGEGPQISLTGGVSGLLPVANGGTASNTAAGARTALGLGSIATQNASNVAITGGSISGLSSLTSTGLITGDAGLTYRHAIAVSSFALATPSGFYRVTSSDPLGPQTNGVWQVHTQLDSTLTYGYQIAVGEFGGSPSVAGKVATRAMIDGTWQSWSFIARENAVAITGGSITGITDLAVADGGTGASTAAAARTNLGSTTVGDAVFTAANAAAGRTALSLGTMATQNAAGVAITGGSVAGITDLAVADGGTGASTAADARTNLGVNIELISTTTLVSGSAFNDITLPTGYTSFELELISVTPTVAADLALRVWDAGALMQGTQYSFDLLAANAPNTLVYEHRSGQSSQLLTGYLTNNTAATGAAGTVRFIPWSAASPSTRMLSEINHVAVTGGTRWQTTRVAGSAGSTARPTAIRVFPLGTTFSSGTVILRGYKS